MGYDRHEQSNSSGAAVAIVAAVLIVAVLGIVLVGGAALYWVLASKQQVEAVAMEQRAVAEVQRAEAEAQNASADTQLEQSRGAAGSGSRLNFMLEIDREGNLNVAGNVIGLDELKKRLAEFKDKSHNTFILHIDADPESPAKHIIAVLEVCDELSDIDYQITSSETTDIRMTATVASYESAAEWDHFDDGTFSAYDKLTLKVVKPERHSGTTFSVTVPPIEIPEDSAYRTTDTRLTFAIRESNIGATGIAWAALNDATIEQ